MMHGPMNITFKHLLLLSTRYTTDLVKPPNEDVLSCCIFIAQNKYRSHLK